MTLPTQRQMMVAWTEDFYFDGDEEDDTDDLERFVKVTQIREGFDSEEITVIFKDTQTGKFYAGDLYFISWDQSGEEFETVREVEPYEVMVTKYRKIKR